MSGTLPHWIERLLGVEAGPGEGTVWSIEHSWGWPPWVTLLATVFAVTFVVMIYLRENREASRRLRLALAAVRLGILAIVLLMIAQFMLSLERTGLPYVAVLVDDSLSMSIVDRYDEKLRKKLEKQIEKAGLGQLSRLNLAKALLCEDHGKLLGGIAADYKLRVYFLTGTRPASAANIEELLEETKTLEATGESSRLGAAVHTVLDDLRGTAPAAVVLLSDGINTDGPTLAKAAEYSRRKGVPLFTVGLGDEKPVRDLKLRDLLVEEVVFVDDIVQFEFKLSGTGYQGRRVQIMLRQQGKPGVLAKMEATIGPDGQPQQLRLPYRPEREGEFRYVVEVESLEGELETENNRQERTVRVRKEQIRVLFVQGYPSFEFRYLRNMLTRDDTIQLNTFLQDAELEYVEQDSAALRVFPVRRDELFQYDVIMLGDVNPALLSDSVMQNVAEFVDQQGKGGALIFIAGPEYMPLAYRNTPLARLMPVDLNSARYPDPDQVLSEGFVVQPTELGLASPPLQLGLTPTETRTIWQNLPPLYWMLEAPELKPAVHVFLEHPQQTGREGRRLPIACMQYVGAGKVLFHTTDETWRWRWRTGDVFFARYWIQMIRYLSRSKLVEGDRSATLSTDRREYRRGESVRLRVRFADQRLAPAADDGVTVVLEHQGHKTRRMKLRRNKATRGVFEGVLSKPLIGNYHAWVALPTLEGQAPATDFTVMAPPGEFERVRMAAAELRRVAERTKGRFYTPATAHRLLKDLPEGHQVPVESLPPKPLWNKWPVLLLFLILLVGEWILRKAGGMV